MINGSTWTREDLLSRASAPRALNMLNVTVILCLGDKVLVKSKLRVFSHTKNALKTLRRSNEMNY